MAIISAQSIVFISASRRDQEWRERLKAALSVSPATDVWDDSRIAPGARWSEAIATAIDAAAIAVVLLSQDYLDSQTALLELGQLAQRARSGDLRIVPVVIHECRWQDVPLLREVQVWGSGKPLDRLDASAIEGEFEELATAITTLAVASAAHTVVPEVGTGPSAVDKELRLSENTDAVLDQARHLVERSHRRAVTSSCLLFALAESAGAHADTARFVRDLMARSGKYNEAFAAFLGDSADAQPANVIDDHRFGSVSRNVAALLEAAAAFSRRTLTRTQVVHQRHIFAALIIAPVPFGQPQARRRLEDLGLDIRAVAGEFRSFIRSSAAGDRQDAWDAILKATEPSAESSAQHHGALPDGHAFTTGPAGYSPEFCGIGSRSVVSDHLGVGPTAERLAELIALRETRLPLAIGLFGQWGTGKSHFMNLIDNHIKAVSQKDTSEGPWCREVVTIYFNAWHYLDANLWASLVSEIFDGLFRHLQPKQDALDLVRAQLRHAGGAAAHAEEEVAEARAAVQQATAALDAARARSERAQEAMQGLFDNLRTLMPEITSSRARHRIEEWLGVSADVATLSQLVDKHREMASLPGRLRELWRRVSAREQRWWRLGWLLGVLVVAPLAVSVAAAVLPALQPLLERAGPWVQRILAWIIGAIVWLAPAFASVQKRVRQMERVLEDAETAQAARSQNPDITEARQRVVQAEASAVAAEAALADARAQQQRLLQAADDARPERRLVRFIEARAQSPDYRGQLGLVSLARRDFKALSDIFADSKALGDRLQDLSHDDAEDLVKLSSAIDRIVLFVDDLDRCQPERVVDVLQAVHLLLAYPLFAVVVGVDQRCLQQSLRLQFKGLLTDDASADARPAAVADLDRRPATPLDYLEKIFHIPFHLPPMNAHGYARLMEKLTTPAPLSTTTGEAAPRTGSRIESSQDGQAGARDSMPSIGEPVDPANAIVEPLLSTPPSSSMSGHAATGATSVTTRPTMGSVPLQPWERAALTAYHPLVRTPRAATRLLNTYRLLRAGVLAEEWDAFRGDGHKRGEFRIAMLLLATAAGHPAHARQWFDQLGTATPHALLQSGTFDKPDLSHLFERVYRDTVDVDETAPDPSFAKWIGRVEQFTF